MIIETGKPIYPPGLKRFVPSSLRPLAQRINRLARRCVAGAWNAADALRPTIRTCRYRGFTVYYTRGNTLIPRIAFGGIYEPELSRAINEALASCASPTLLDIGANIGLLTLNVLAETPAARIFACEPSPTSVATLAETLAVNRLEDRVTLVREAFSRENGVAEFTVHEAWTSSADGFLHTGRMAGGTSVQVKTRRVDDWWVEAGRPKLDVVKIDTEGSELWILQGAEMLLRECAPVLFLEISPLNLWVYPHTAQDVLRWLHAHRYRLFALDGRAATAASLESLLRTEDTFMARPDSDALDAGDLGAC
jgi:FkbM family methyltransferase